MSYILGLDTGGTYTDGVLIDVHTKQVVSKAKALTTKQDLKVGIEACLDALNIQDPDRIGMTVLSTTLATNAIVENRGGKTGLILIGNKRPINIPTEYVEVINGELDIKGNILVPLSEEQAIDAVNRLSKKVDSIAVSTYAGIRNPQYELRVKKLIKRMSELPVFCAHEIADSLGFEERTITAVLNASLIGIIREFLGAVKKALNSRKINAQIMVVKSDGSLMRKEVALERPIDTILSGPAASAIGAKHLTGAMNALVVDMGGTTIDIADITNGIVKTSNACAKVAGWKTKVNSVEISTHGTGGDSWIQMEGEIKVGPYKAESIARCAYYYPNLRGELAEVYSNPDLSCMEKNQLSQCYCLIDDSSIKSDNKAHNKITKLLRDQPHSMLFLVRKAGQEALQMIEEMLREGKVNIIDLTPTDILHILGQYEEWDRDAAVLRGKMAAEANLLDLETFAIRVQKAVCKKIYSNCIQAIADFEQGTIDMAKDNAAKYLIDKMFYSKEGEFLKVCSKVKKPVIAVGAPAEAWLPAVSEKMNARIIIPKDAEVANAIGSAFGKVSESAEALIRKEPGKRKYSLYLPSEKKVFYSKKAAQQEAEKMLMEIARERARAAGCSHADIVVSCKDFYTEYSGEKRKRYVESKIKASAAGKPDAWYFA